MAARSNDDTRPLAVVTGGASGIGAEFCRQLAAEGWRVARVDCRECADATELDLTLDLTSPDSDSEVMNHVRRLGATPRLLINNAGVFDFRAVTDMTPARFDLYLDLHCRAVTRLCRAMAPAMQAEGGGMILNMSSMSCWMPMPGIAMYAATKAYIRAFSRALRLELKGSGVSVTVACPGGIATDLFGLPPKLQRLGVRVGALYTPRRFVRGALRATRRRRKQYINGWLNRLAIAAVGMTPDFLRQQVKPLLLDRLSK